MDMRAGRAAILIGVSLLMAGCSSSTNTASITSSPSAANTAGVTSSPSAAGSVQPSPLPAVSTELTCRLPISDGTSGSGGFITFPGGQLAADASSQVKVPGPAAGGRSSFGLSYDRGYHKWLPVPYDWVSPDGTRYVYPMGTTLAVVSVATGAIIQVLTKQQWAYWWPLDVENNGVWAMNVYDSTLAAPVEGPFDLFFVSFAGTISPAIQTYPSSGPFHFAVRGHIGYDAYSNPVAPGQKASGTLVRSDFSNGQASLIFGTGNSSDPYVWAGVASDTVFLIVNDNQLVAIVGADPAQKPVALGGDLPKVGVGAYSVLGDAKGIWIAGERGLYLMTPSGVARASDHTGVLAGSCG
jgi:hypothetical protein